MINYRLIFSLIAAPALIVVFMDESHIDYLFQSNPFICIFGPLLAFFIAGPGARKSIAAFSSVFYLQNTSAKTAAEIKQLFTDAIRVAVFSGLLFSLTRAYFMLHAFPGEFASYMAGVGWSLLFPLYCLLAVFILLVLKANIREEEKCGN